MDLRLLRINRGEVISTYFFSVGVTEKIHRLKSEFTKLSSFDSDEMDEHKFNNGFDILIFGKDKNSSIQKKHHNFFRGMLVNHEDGEIVFGQNGFDLWKQKTERKDYGTFEGGFLSIEWSAKRIHIQHDCFGLYPIFCYNDHEICIASDSLFMISKAMKIIGKPVRLNQNTNLTRSWTYGLACSIMTRETIIQDVFYIMPCSNLEITTHGSNLICLEKHLDIKKVFDSEKKPYMETLVQAKNEIISLTNSVTENSTLGYKLGLSGGLDSRVILALLLQLSKGLKNVHINSNIHVSRKEDYTVAKSLSEKFGFQINQEIPAGGNKSIRVTNPFGNFVLFNLGVFDMTYLYRSYWDTPTIIEIGGHGAEIAKGTFSNVRLTRKMPLWRPDKKIALHRDIRSSLNPFGIKMRTKDSTQWHHLLYKSAIQNGRYLERTQISLRPLMNRKLAALGLNNDYNKNTILKDLLILLSPELAAEPFDEFGKNIDRKYIEKIIKESSNYNTKSPREYIFYGNSEMMKNGLLHSFNSLLQQYELKAIDKKKAILDLMEKIWSEIGDEKLKRAYSNAYEMAQKRLNDENSYLPSAGSPASKIIALGILFD